VAQAIPNMEVEMHTKNQISLTRKILYGMMLLAGFLAAFGAGNLPPARAQGDTAKTPTEVVVSISADKVSFGAAEQVTLQVTITNPNAGSIRVLSWFTPAEGVSEPLFTVTRTGEPVAYLGPLVKRAAPTGQDYITVAAGGSLTRAVDLSAYYDLSASGNYAVRYDVASADLYADVDNPAGSLASNTLNLFIEGRVAHAPQAIPAQNVTGTNTFNGCSASQQTDLVNARNGTSTYATGAVAYFSANKQGGRYTTWFGVYDLGRYNTVSSHFSAISNAVDTANPMSFDCTSTDPSYYAYVYPNLPYNIYFGGAFWDAPMTGTDSKAGTLIHEISHFTVVAGTQDHVYGQSGAKNLAISNPDHAANNADNHEYFAENNPPLETTSTFTISGNAGVAGATLAYTGGSTTADGSGSYSFAVLSGWSGTVTPSLSGYTFAPPNRTYTNVVSDQTAQDYIATAIPTFTISGNAGIAGATLTYTGGSTIADGSGFYTFTVLTGWSGTVTPSKAGYTFTPVSRAYTNVVSDQTAQDYTAVPVASFVDVPTTYWAWDWIERLYNAGITTGCSASPLLYCPDDSVTRAQMAVFLERGVNGSAYTPPAGTGAVFADVPLSYWVDSWIEKLYADGITNGCVASPLAYCPDDPVTRAQMAKFLLMAKHGASYTPPDVGASTGFGDVSTSDWAAAWIKQLAAEGITSGCGGGNYCPENSVTRAEMAKFLVLTFGLP
jgi:peptidyl-Lys metalloendopeptidase